MTVRQLLESMDSRELSEWMAFFKVRDEDPKDHPACVDEKIKAVFSGFGAKKNG